MVADADSTNSVAGTATLQWGSGPDEALTSEPLVQST